MKPYLFFPTAILPLVTGLVSGGSYSRASTATFQPGDFLFPIQHTAEETGVALAHSPAGKAAYCLRLARQRVTDLESALGTSKEADALFYLDEALAKLAHWLSVAPPQEATSLYPGALNLIAGVEILLSKLVIVPEASLGALGGACQKCHPSGGADWTCYNCPDKAETVSHHEEKGILNNIAGRCLECHPKGKED